MLRWLQNHPQFLELAYKVTENLINKMKPIIRWWGYGRVSSLLHGGEILSKQTIFDCRMCGQCILHSTGMTCPMTCPKNMRNGPCGGVRQNGHCEVIPEMKCVWLQAFDRSTKMNQFGYEIQKLQPPVNWQLEGDSAWINLLTGADQKTPDGWVDLTQIYLIPENDLWKHNTNLAAG